MNNNIKKTLIDILNKENPDIKHTTIIHIVLINYTLTNNEKPKISDISKLLTQKFTPYKGTTEYHRIHSWQKIALKYHETFKNTNNNNNNKLRKLKEIISKITNSNDDEKINIQELIHFSVLEGFAIKSGTDLQNMVNYVFQSKLEEKPKEHTSSINKKENNNTATEIIRLSKEKDGIGKLLSTLVHADPLFALLEVVKYHKEEIKRLNKET